VQGGVGSVTGVHEQSPRLSQRAGNCRTAGFRGEGMGTNPMFLGKICGGIVPGRFESSRTSCAEEVRFPFPSCAETAHTRKTRPILVVDAKIKPQQG